MNELVVPETNQDGVTALEQARALQVVDNDSYRVADEMAVALKGLEKQVDSLFDEHIKRANEAHKALTSKKKLFATPIIEARGLVKNKMDQFRDEQERLRLAEERRLQAIADKLAEEQQLADALSAEKAGDSAAATAIVAEPVQSPVIIVPKALPKTATVIRKVVDKDKITAAIGRTNGKIAIPGVHIYQIWTFNVVDAAQVPSEYKKTA